MKIAITATSKARLTEYQLDAARELIEAEDEVHIGDCVNGDAQVHAVCVEVGARTVGHPPITEAKRAFCEYNDEHPPRQYIERNHDMVDECELLLAFPKSHIEEVRSGTWATVRYARQIGREVTIIPPYPKSTR